MLKHVLFYLFLLSVFGASVFLILEVGTRLYPVQTAAPQTVEGAPAGPDVAPRAAAPVRASHAAGGVRENMRHPLSILLLQVIAVLLTAKVAGHLFRKIGQPTAVGEMLAGIVLGPSVLGALSPELMTFLFPPHSMEGLRLLSQIGIIIFMFVVGAQFNVQHLRQKAHVAVFVSHVSILLPFILGAALSLLIYSSSAPAGITFYAFALFISVAMSITAFPVLAHIIKERGLTGSLLGTTAIACAAVDDVTAWCLLAAVIALLNAGGPGEALPTIVLTLCYAGAMLFLLRPRADGLLNRAAGTGERGGGRLMSVVLLFVFAAALLTELIGVHALFGAFLAGVVLPLHGPRARVTEQLGTFTTSLLLPLYFVFTGLRTQVGLVNDWSGWLVCAGIMATALAGKLGGGALAARWMGMSWHDSLVIGVLMNTRGLMELIVLNIGYDLGILSPRIFSLMVIMALATTAMTGPLLSLLESLKQRRAVGAGRAGMAAEFLGGG